jgi:hypothetical protein
MRLLHYPLEYNDEDKSHEPYDLRRKDERCR